MFMSGVAVEVSQGESHSVWIGWQPLCGLEETLSTRSRAATGQQLVVTPTGTRCAAIASQILERGWTTSCATPRCRKPRLRSARVPCAANCQPEAKTLDEDADLRSCGRIVAACG